MLISSIDNENVQVKRNIKIMNDVTKLMLNGPFLEIEGYATVDGVITHSEERIRKTLLIVPLLDVAKIREEEEHEEELKELTDEEIIEMRTISIPLDNCKISELQVELDERYSDSLAGYKANIDLATLINGKPLLNGEYDVYLKLEQLPADRDDVKYEKIFPLSNIKRFMKGGILTTKLEYFSASKVLKYNLMLTFDKSSKTLRLKNHLLQSYDPRDMPDSIDVKENRIIRAIKRRVFKLFYILFCLLPINSKKIVFASDSRSHLSGNLYFVYEELYKRNLNVDITFILKERINNKKTLPELLKTAYHFATAKIILLDDFYPLIYPLRIRKNADLIQVWHAAGAFKTFGFSRMGRPGGPSPRSKNHKNYTKAAVSSEGVRKHYAEGFGISIDNVYATGVPRSDIFFDEQYKAHVKKTLHEKYPFLKEKKVILFAPTFRGNGQASAYYPFEILNLKELYRELHEEYVFLFKIHPFVKNKLTIPYEFADFYYDFSDYREINDLLLVTDLLITDYSSVCFEFALLNKPMLFFAFDVEKYIEDRDFYYDYFDFIPGPLVKDTSEIISAIKQGKFELEKIEPFVKYFFDDTLGKATSNVVDQLIIPSLEGVQEDKDTDKELTPPESRIDLFNRTIEEE